MLANARLRGVYERPRRFCDAASTTARVVRYCTQMEDQFPLSHTWPGA